MKKREPKKKTVFVGLSGGVDSSVAAHLLLKQGYTVVGVFIRTWQPEFIQCTWRDERRDAMRVAAHLGIPFLECDAEESYKKGVADYMIEEYKKGRTPNPDVMCNREVKFGTFWEFAKKHGADFIATGHYARICFPSLRREGAEPARRKGLSLSKNPSGAMRQLPLAGEQNPTLAKGLDPSKDQSYFLWTLTKEDLAHTLFPIGHLAKKEVRKIAEYAGLTTATKKDSQGVCFLGPLDMKDFLKHYIKEKKGNVVDEKGKILGTHDGALFYTLGERHGFSIKEKTNKEKPYYVIAKDVIKNTITVSHDSSGMRRPDESRDPGQRAKNISPGSRIKLRGLVVRDDEVSNAKNKKLTAQIRYHGELFPVTIISKNELAFAKPVLVASGQSVVLYDGELCIGGGVVV